MGTALDGCCKTDSTDVNAEVRGELRPCQSQQLDNLTYHTSQMMLLVKLQRRIREFLDRKRAVRNYEIICPPELRGYDTENVKVSALLSLTINSTCVCLLFYRACFRSMGPSSTPTLSLSRN
jgi:hypothetical protein